MQIAAVPFTKRISSLKSIRIDLDDKQTHKLSSKKKGLVLEQTLFLSIRVLQK